LQNLYATQQDLWARTYAEYRGLSKNEEVLKQIKNDYFPTKNASPEERLAKSNARDNITQEMRIASGALGYGFAPKSFAEQMFPDKAAGLRPVSFNPVPTGGGQVLTETLPGR
jgi:hypothetical protein